MGGKTSKAENCDYTGDIKRPERQGKGGNLPLALGIDPVHILRTLEIILRKGHLEHQEY